MSRTSDKIRRARGTVDDVMLELFGPQIVDGQCHSRLVGIASDCAERNQHAARKIAIDQRLEAGLHMCLTVASAALEVSRELLSTAAYAHVGNGESALNRCAQDADLVVQAARRAHAILASQYGGSLSNSEDPHRGHPIDGIRIRLRHQALLCDCSSARQSLAPES